MDQTRTANRLLLENAVTALAYWGVSHINYLLFKHVGVLPMPIWPAAALAFVVAFYRGWSIAPGIALGTVLANHFSLHSSWSYACLIAVMNTLGPLAGAAIMRKRVAREILIRTLADVLVCCFAALILAPALTALGGIGFKWLLGLIQSGEVATAYIKWALAHSLGTLLFALPAFAWLKGRKT